MRTRIAAPEDGLCTADDCFDDHYAKGFCKRHYYQNKRGRLETSFKRGKYRYDSIGDRWCTYHEQYHDPVEFSSNSQMSDGLASSCKEARKWQALTFRYGVTEQWFKKKLEDQNGLCAICLTNEATHIDHDHMCCDSRKTCGKCVRDILCMQCNARLFALETESWFESAMKYVSRHGGKKA